MTSRDDAWVAIIRGLHRVAEQGLYNSNGLLRVRRYYILQQVDESQTRTVRRVLDRLHEEGWLTVDYNGQLVVSKRGMEMFGLSGDKP